MTKREALEIMLIMWDHIAINKCSKYDAVEQLGLNSRMDSNCSLCEQATGDDKVRRCSKCLVDWPETIFSFSNAKCEHSYYQEWKAFGESRKTYAHKIANLALDKLNELYPEE